MIYLGSRYSRSGFTVVELMVAVSLVGILSSVAVPTFQKYVFDATEVEGVQVLSQAFRDQMRVQSECKAGNHTHCIQGPFNFTELLGSAQPGYPTLLYEPAANSKFNLITGNSAPAFSMVSGAKFSTRPTTINNLFGYASAGGSAGTGGIDPNKFMMGAEATINGREHLMGMNESGLIYRICDAWTGGIGPGASVYQQYYTVAAVCSSDPGDDSDVCTGMDC